jgi:hypothetical protein
MWLKRPLSSSMRFMSARGLWDMDLRERCMDLPRMRRVLSSLAVLPGELPFLTDIAALCAGTPGVEPETAASWGPVRRGLNRRYLRIRCNCQIDPVWQ